MSREAGPLGWRHPARVAAVVASLMAVIFVSVTVPFDLANAHHLVRQVDSRVSDRLKDIVKESKFGFSLGNYVPADRDVDDAPVVFWQLDASGRQVARSPEAPALPANAWSRRDAMTTANLGGTVFRLKAGRSSQGWLVAGESLSSVLHVEAVLQRAELVVGPIFVVAMFFGALAIGVLASRPVEQARRRQLEFTADASHELRTPLTVIEAEVSLALSSRRDGASYREALGRVGAEGRRLRRIVEDLLFLARFDAAPPRPGDEPVDLATLAEACSERFRAVAQARDIDLQALTDATGEALVTAPPAWVDRLCGVLLDNACKYAGTGGWARVIVSAKGGTVSLAVEDSGPGVPPEERSRLFDRFHRGTDRSEGAGLGLAIADAIVRSTGGRWKVAEAPGGGAHMEVVWRRSHRREAVPSRGLRADRQRPRPGRAEGEAKAPPAGGASVGNVGGPGAGLAHEP